MKDEERKYRQILLSDTAWLSAKSFAVLNKITASDVTEIAVTSMLSNIDDPDMAGRQFVAEIEKLKAGKR